MMRRYEIKTSALPTYAAPRLAKFGGSRSAGILTKRPAVSARATLAPRIQVSVAPIVPSVLL